MGIFELCLNLLVIALPVTLSDLWKGCAIRRRPAAKIGATPAVAKSSEVDSSGLVHAGIAAGLGAVAGCILLWTDVLGLPRQVRDHSVDIGTGLIVILSGVVMTMRLAIAAAIGLLTRRKVLRSPTKSRQRRYVRCC
jgi:hypothetical protein